MILEHAVKQFLEHQLANGRSPHTIGAHQRDLKLLINHLGGEIQVERITPHDLDRFLELRIVHGQRPTFTAGEYLVAVKRKGGEPCQAAAGTVLISSRMGLCCVLDDPESVDGSNVINGLHVGRMTV